MKDFPQGFVIGAALVLFAWFGADGHRREQLVEKPWGFDRPSFNAGAASAGAAIQKDRDLLSKPSEVYRDAVWYEWTNNSHARTEGEERYREFRRDLARTNNNDNHIRIRIYEN